MHHCYRCGREIKTRTLVRRRVKTGEFIRRAYGRNRVTGVSERYGMRVVCPFCAKSLDDTSLRNIVLANLPAGIALLVLIVSLLVLRIMGSY